MLSEIAVDRLIKVRNHLRDNVKDERFNLVTWAGNNEIPWEGDPDLSCGTTACAMGWATTIPEFRELGFLLIASGGSKNQGTLYYEGKHSLGAVTKFLDISEFNAEYLFIVDEYPHGVYTTRMEVVDRITQFLKDQV